MHCTVVLKESSVVAKIFVSVVGRANWNLVMPFPFSFYRLSLLLYTTLPRFINRYLFTNIYSTNSLSVRISMAGATFDMSGFGNNPSIRSLCLSVDGRAILLGTKGGNVFEISSVDGSDVRGGPFASGHCMGSLRAVMTHPSKPQFLTAGDDCKVRIWDTVTRTLLKVAHFDAEVRAAAYSPLGDCIAVGFGMVVRDPFGSPNQPSTDEKLTDEELADELRRKAGAFTVVSEEGEHFSRIGLRKTLREVGNSLTL